MELGLQPNYLTDDVLKEIFNTIDKYKERINSDSIFRVSSGSNIIIIKSAK